MSEKLARCGLKTVKFNTGFGGIPELTPDDLIMQLGIAQRQGVLSEIASMFALSHYANLHDDGDKKIILQFIVSNMYIQAKRQKFKVGKVLSLLPVIASLAIDTVVNSTHCTRCNGTGLTIEHGECRLCSGTGYKQISRYQKAKICGLYDKQKNTVAWLKSHDFLFNYAVQMVTQWKDEISKALRNI